MSLWRPERRHWANAVADEGVMLRRPISTANQLTQRTLHKWLFPNMQAEGVLLSIFLLCFKRKSKYVIKCACLALECVAICTHSHVHHLHPRVLGNPTPIGYAPHNVLCANFVVPLFFNVDVEHVNCLHQETDPTAKALCNSSACCIVAVLIPANALLKLDAEHAKHVTSSFDWSSSIHNSIVHHRART